MSGTKAGGQKLRDKMLSINPKYYEELGAKGGSAERTKLNGFALMKALDPEHQKQIAAKGGRAGRKNKPTPDGSGY